MLDQIPAVLTWQDAPEALSRLYRRHLDYVSGRLGAALAAARRADPADGERLLDAVRALPPGAVGRLLAAPETFGALTRAAGQSEADARAFLWDAVAAEQRRAGDPGDARIPLSHPVWTALGDASFPADAPAAAIPDGGDPAPPAAPVAGDARYEAQRLTPGTLLDHGSPFARRDLPGADGPPGDLAPDELQDVRRRLEEALQGLAQVSAPARRLFDVFTRVVVLRKEDAAPASSGSASSSGYIGRTALFNPQRMTTVQLAEALLHEAVHSLLYVIELDRPFLPHPDAPDSDAGRVISPWTGARLPLHAYLHACFVWYGLWRFWTLAAAGAGPFPATAAAERVDLCARGFCAGSLVSALGPAAAWVDPDLRDVLAEVQDAVRGAVLAAPAGTP